MFELLCKYTSIKKADFISQLLKMYVEYELFCIG